MAENVSKTGRIPSARERLLEIVGSEPASKDPRFVLVASETIERTDFERVRFNYEVATAAEAALAGRSTARSARARVSRSTAAVYRSVWDTMARRGTLPPVPGESRLAYGMRARPEAKELAARLEWDDFLREAVEVVGGRMKSVAEYGLATGQVKWGARLVWVLQIERDGVRRVLDSIVVVPGNGRSRTRAGEGRKN